MSPWKYEEPKVSIVWKLLVKAGLTCAVDLVVVRNDNVEVRSRIRPFECVTVTDPECAVAQVRTLLCLPLQFDQPIQELTKEIKSIGLFYGVYVHHVLRDPAMKTVTIVFTLPENVVANAMDRPENKGLSLSVLFRAFTERIESSVPDWTFKMDGPHPAPKK